MGSSRRIRVAVDLTPLRVGGENGGAKTLVTTLLREFACCCSDRFEYLLIANASNYEELKHYQSDNMTCLTKSEIYSGLTQSSNLPKISEPVGTYTTRRYEKIIRQPVLRLFKKTATRFTKKVTGKLLHLQRRLLIKLKSSSSPALKSVERYVRNIQTFFQPRILQKKHQVDLLFCPFSAPTLAEKGLPLVAIAYDLQHLDLPFFFEDIERSHRTRFLHALNYQSTKIVCISEFTRQSFITNLRTPPDKLTAIPICIHERLEKQSDEYVGAVLSEQGIQRDRYLLFPANFWPHKNHRLLLAAYAIYQKRFGEQALDLVFTGALKGSAQILEELAKQMGLADKVHFLGFLQETELVAIWQGTQGLVFPSLYEGFGIPVLEALWFSKPVACSEIGSLPEVGGDAVIYFDPRKPEEVAEAMGKIGHNPAVVSSLVAKAQSRLLHFQKQKMTAHYLSVFESAVATRL